MANIPLADLKQRFLTNEQPSQKDFVDLIDTMAFLVSTSIANDSIIPAKLQHVGFDALMANISNVVQWAVPDLQLLKSSFFLSDTGVANALVITPTPPVAAYDLGQVYLVKVSATCTGPSTIAVSGLAAKSIVKATTALLAAGDLQAGQVVLLAYDGANFQLFAPSQLKGLYSVDTGTVNALAIAPTPPIAAYAVGQVFTLLVSNCNTNACTLAVSGLAPKTIKKSVTFDLAPNDILQGQLLTVIYDANGCFQVFTPLDNPIYIAPSFVTLTDLDTGTGNKAVTTVDVSSYCPANARMALLLMQATCTSGNGPGTTAYVQLQVRKASGSPQVQVFQHANMSTEGVADESGHNGFCMAMLTPDRKFDYQVITGASGAGASVAWTLSIIGYM